VVFFRIPSLPRQANMTANRANTARLGRSGGCCWTRSPGSKKLRPMTQAEEPAD
jgi:hypothetical protein